MSLQILTALIRTKEQNGTYETVFTVSISGGIAEFHGLKSKPCFCCFREAKEELRKINCIGYKYERHKGDKIIPVTHLFKVDNG